MVLLKLTSIFLALVTVSVWQCEAKTYTNSWAVSVKGGPAAADKLASKYGFINKGQVSILEDVYHFVMPEHTLMGKKSISGLPVYHLSQSLKDEPAVSFAEQQSLFPVVKQGYSVPNDPEWTNQWQLLNTGQLDVNDTGNDLKIERAWLQGLTGCGIVVAIADDGVEYTHTDLLANYDASLQLDPLGGDMDPFPIVVDGVRESHGTRCAGIIGMSKNNSNCGVGVAYNSEITGLRMLGESVTELTIVTALGHKLNEIDIYSNSWGILPDGRSSNQFGMLGQALIQNALREGRQGKGTIYVFVTGNGGAVGDNCGLDGFATNMNFITIGSVGVNGEQPFYDEQCAGKLAVAFVDDNYQPLADYFSGTHVTTTSVNDTCVNGFVGTSAAVPLASGIIALTLEANKDLTLRDIQYLIAYTSNRDILKNGEWITNGADPPLRVSHKFGFGVLDAEAMVSRARHWITVPSRVSITGQTTQTTRMVESNETLVTTYTFESSSIGFLEHVTVEVSFNFPDVVNENNPDYGFDKNGTLREGPYRGNIQMELISPSNTESIIMPFRIPDVTSEAITNFPLTSVHFWGEAPNGMWTLTVRNRNNFVNATLSLTIHSINFYGTRNTPSVVSQIPDQCDEVCDSSRGCAAAGPQYCDACANLRNAVTLECIDACPQGFTQRSGYCYDASIPEVGCVRGGAEAIQAMSLLILSIAALVSWMSTN